MTWSSNGFLWTGRNKSNEQRTLGMSKKKKHSIYTQNGCGLQGIIWNFRVEVKKRVELLARSIAAGGWKPVDRFLCFLPASEMFPELVEILICLAGHHVSKKYDLKKGIDRSRDLEKFDPALVERVSFLMCSTNCSVLQALSFFVISLQALNVKFKEGDGHHKLDALYELLDNRSKYQKYIDQYEQTKGMKWALPKYIQVFFCRHCFADTCVMMNVMTNGSSMFLNTDCCL
jgi:hypothetical protein